MNNLENAGSWLFETLLTLYALVLLLRLLLQWVKADYRNPLVQILVAITDPLVKPLRRLVPAWGRLDTATAILFVLCVTVIVALWDPLATEPLLLIARSVIRVLQMVLSLYFLLIIAHVILSWVGQSLRHPIIPLIYQLTEPLLAPIRRLLPAMGGLDLSPLVALLAIQFLRILVGY